MEQCRIILYNVNNAFVLKKSSVTLKGGISGILNLSGVREELKGLKEEQLRNGSLRASGLDHYSFHFKYRNRRIKLSFWYSV